MATPIFATHTTKVPRGLPAADRRKVNANYHEGLVWTLPAITDAVSSQCRTTKFPGPVFLTSKADDDRWHQSANDTEHNGSHRGNEQLNDELNN
jgi:hypothetical protein